MSPNLLQYNPRWQLCLAAVKVSFGKITILLIGYCGISELPYFARLPYFAVAVTEVTSRKQPQVPEHLKTLTEPYSASFPTFPFQRPLPSRPNEGLLTTFAAEDTWLVVSAWLQISRSSWKQAMKSPFELPTQSKTKYNHCYWRSVPVPAVWH